MKTKLTIIATIAVVLLATLSLLAFKSHARPEITNNYEDMWEKVTENLNKNLPETAEKELNAIEKQAEKDANQVQLLKTILYRQQIMRFTVEEDPGQAFIRYAEAQFERLDEVPQAILHEEIAKAYADYLETNSWNIQNNLPIDGDLSNIEMKYWDKGSLRRLIDHHYTEALKPVKALTEVATHDYLPLYETKQKVTDYIEYEPSLFEFMFHRVARYYQEQSTADDIQADWNTSDWWLTAEAFAKADLGNSSSPIIRCLAIFQQIITYNLENSKEDVLIYNDYNRFQFVNRILDESDNYLAALDDLKAKHSQNQLSANITALIAERLIADCEQNNTDSSYFDHLKNAKAMCEKAVADFPNTAGAKKCQSVISRIEAPQIHAELNRVQLPNESIPVFFEYKNVTKPYYRIVRVTEKEQKKLNSLDEKELLKALVKCKAVAEAELDIPAETDYRSHRTLIALPALKNGIYYLVASTNKANQDIEKTLILDFQVSSLSFVTSYDDTTMTLVTLDRKTGKTIEGANVELCKREYNYKKRTFETIILDTKKTDKNGLVVLNRHGDNNPFCINLRKGGDTLLSENYFHLYQNTTEREAHFSTCLLTDRAIYRPGQTIYFNGIVTRTQGDDKSLVKGYDETIRLFDANWQEISRASFVTDEYGSFNGSFVIPTGRLNGHYHLQAQSSSVDLLVEEYKRPSFEVNFQSPKEQYRLNKEVTVAGSVDAYAGFGLDNVEYSYRVVRKTSFPWRCWWWYYPSIEDEQITFGKARTDETGKFAITFNLKPSLKTKPEQQPVFTYEIEVTATSAQGETHSNTYSIRAGYNSIAINTNIPDVIELSTLGDYSIEAVNMSGEATKSRISRTIYRLDDNSKISYYEAFNHKVNLDRQVLNDADLERHFPNYSFYEPRKKTLVYHDELMADNKVKFYEATLTPGKYYVELKSLDDTLAQIAKEFKVYSNSSKQMPFTAPAWIQSDKATALPGDEIHFSLGTSAKDAEMWVQLIHGKEIRLDRWIRIDNGVQTISYKVQEHDRGGLMLRTAFVKENSVRTNDITISVPYDNLDLNVKLATLRDKLSPGAEETWEVTVADYKDKPLEAALVAGMYDASLDEFAYHYWNFDMRPSSAFGRQFMSDTPGFASSYTSLGYFHIGLFFNFSLPSDAPFFDAVYYSRRECAPIMYCKTANTSDWIVEEMCLDESAPMLEESINAKGSNPLEMPDVESEITEVQDDLAEEITQGGNSSEPALRENFNETAFFFPNLRTNADGSASFTFTMPDALTRWNLMLLAYTKDRQTGQQRQSFTTTKPVMIMADMPRYMYDTDTLWFVANVINTGDEAIAPKAKLEIFDATSMEPIDLLVTDAVIPMQELMPGRSQQVRWKVASQYDLKLLAFRFTAYADQFSDAEQHLLPILSSEIFMTQTLPITVKAETEQRFDFDCIAKPNSHERDYSLTLNFSTNPMWYAVQSLPSLANLNTDRAESAFYVFYANTLSSYLANHIPNLMAYIKKWQIETPDALLSQLEKDQDLKAIMLQETPWVLEAKNENEQRSRIATLFEINTIRQQQNRALGLIEDKQKYNGGWSWRDGMPESPWISTYILSGFGKLQKMGAWTSLSDADQRTAQRICEKAVRYLEYQVAESYREMTRHKKEWPIGSTTLSELYALSFFKEQNSDRDFAAAKKYYLGSLEKEWTKFSFNDKSKAAVILYRYSNEKAAKLMIQSFKECAQKDEQLGIYWPKKYFAFESHIATHANIMAAFAEIDQDQALLDQLRVWLLTQKQTNMWENSASTADAIYALLMRGSDWFEEGKEVTLHWGSQQAPGASITTENGVAGTGFIQRHWNAHEVTPDMRQLTVNNPTPHLVWGGLFRQYFVPADEIKSSDAGMSIKRELLVETTNEKGKMLVPIGKRILKVGDKLTVKLTIESQQDMSYVFVKDLRAAGFEPIEQVSGYGHNDGISFYQTNTDTDMEFFIEHLPKGTHQLEYSMFVTKEGNLSNGYALIQCLYAPEFSAYSNGMRVKIGE